MGLSTVRRKLKYLEQRGLIRRGDQRMVAHFDPYHRPVVWDLCLERRRTIDFSFGDDIEASKGGRPKSGSPIRTPGGDDTQHLPSAPEQGEEGGPLLGGTGSSDVAAPLLSCGKPRPAAGGGYGQETSSETTVQADTRFHSSDTRLVSSVAHGTSLVRNPSPHIRITGTGVV